jgi:hypothetical protein
MLNSVSKNQRLDRCSFVRWSRRGFLGRLPADSESEVSGGSGGSGSDFSGGLSAIFPLGFFAGQLKMHNVQTELVNCDLFAASPVYRPIGARRSVIGARINGACPLIQITSFCQGGI